MSVGLSVKRKDALSKVTGKERFADDHYYPEMLQVYTFRSPKPFIKIKKINILKALKSPGVIKILTHKDVPGKNIIPLVFNDYPCLAEKEARFQGQAIALIAAENIENAKKAAGLIELDYTEKRGVFTTEDALKKRAPLVYGKDNTFKKYKIIKGDIRKGFKEADVIVKNDYSTNYQVHTYLETQGAVAIPKGDGSITVYGSMQCPFYVLDSVSSVLGLSKNKVQIIQSAVGGGFGGKEDVPSIVASHAALVTYHTGRPAKLIYNREEDFSSMSKRHPAVIKVKYGAKKNGLITAVDITYVIDGGAFSTLSPIVLWRGTVHAAGPYAIDHVKIRTYAVATNKVPCGAFRGFGQPQVSFAQESLIDELALKCGITPAKIRELNGLKKGLKTATGFKTQVKGVPPVLQAVMKSSGYNTKYTSFKEQNGRIKKGIGLSISYYGVGLGAAGKHLSKAGAFIQVENDGSVRLAFGNTEMGQGAKTVLA
ncbi:MAG: xanthine dehydrogenase family protein molybdopterin-binding subunit, partial [Spirochaetes bacterium]|nr:xanthine dehydrogenase family protein molybdopterin-binding subunit [Spirochaetota bacterium]